MKLKMHEVLLILALLFLVYKRVEGYRPVDSNTKYDSQLDSLYNAGGRPAEIFQKFSPENWAPQSVGYIFDPTVDKED